MSQCYPTFAVQADQGKCEREQNMAQPEGRHDDAPTPAEELENVPAPMPQSMSGMTVLVVDDELSIRTLVAEVLSEQGHAVLQAADGAAALDVLRSNARIDLLVSDLAAEWYERPAGRRRGVCSPP